MSGKAHMRLVFVGATRFGLRCLETAASLPECEVAGIVTGPEVFAISYRPEGVRNVLHADLRPFAEDRGIELHLMKGKMTDPELVEKVRSWRPDFILVVGWYHTVPRAVRAIAPTGGLHASLLPEYSGGAPLVWAMIRGERRTGITFFLLDDGVDSGDIIAQAPETIRDDDTIATLYGRIERRGLELLREQLPKIARGEARFTPQDESRRRITPQRAPEDGEIDWAAPARRVYDFVRAQTRPYPGAFTYLQGTKLTIWRAELSQAPRDDGPPGAVEPAPPGAPEAFGVRCGDGRLLLVREVAPEDGQATTGRAFAVRRGLRAGALLGRATRQPGGRQT